MGASTAFASRRAKPRELETRIHRAIFCYLDATLPRAAAQTLHHARNEGADERERQRAAYLGTHPGWPDLEWAGRMDDDRPYMAFIEVKAPGGRVSAEQQACHDKLRDAGHFVGVARSIDEARDLVRAWGVPSLDAAIHARAAS